MGRPVQIQGQQGTTNSAYARREVMITEDYVADNLDDHVTNTAAVPRTLTLPLNPYAAQGILGKAAGADLIVQGTAHPLAGGPITVPKGKAVRFAYTSAGQWVPVCCAEAPPPTTCVDGYFWGLNTGQIVNQGERIPFPNDGPARGGVDRVAGVSPDQFVVPVDGLYRVHFQYSFASEGDEPEATVYVDGNPRPEAVYGATSFTGQLDGTVMLQLSAGDVVDLRNTGDAPFNLAGLASAAFSPDASLEIELLCAGAFTWTPLDFADLRAFYWAEDPASGPALWKDLSPRHNDASQPVVGDQPALVVEPSLNSKKVFDFAGNKFFENLASDVLDTPGGPFGIFALFLYQGAGAGPGGALFAIRRSPKEASALLFYPGSGFDFFYYGDGVDAGANTAVNSASIASDITAYMNGVWAFHGATTTPSLWLNQRLKPPSVAGVQFVEDGTAGFQIGSNAAGQFCNGKIAALAVVEHDPTPRDMANWMQWLLTVYKV